MSPVSLGRKPRPRRRRGSDPPRPGVRDAQATGDRKDPSVRNLQSAAPSRRRTALDEPRRCPDRDDLERASSARRLERGHRAARATRGAGCRCERGSLPRMEAVSSRSAAVPLHKARFRLQRRFAEAEPARRRASGARRPRLVPRRRPREVLSRNAAARSKLPLSGPGTGTRNRCPGQAATVIPHTSHPRS